MNITVVGTGYVGLSNSVLLAQFNNVIAYDIDLEKIELIKNKISPIVDIEISDFLSHKNLNLTATTDANFAFSKAEIVIIATPTNYDSETHSFDTSTVESVIKQVIDINSSALMVIKSTIPVGYTEEVKKKFNTENIIFSPEFLREGKALYDNLYPSRIIVGEISDRAEKFANLLKQASLKHEVSVLLTNNTEAEAIKLFSNTYLAMRVAYFNELDNYAMAYGLSSQQIIEGVSLDPRVGQHYNNPSFGYGGYCLPKDTKQLLANYKRVPQNLIKAIVDANATRKNVIAKDIIKAKPKRVGIYRLIMKANSDNFRAAAILDIMKLLRGNNIEVVIYEPVLNTEDFDGFKIIKDFNYFSDNCDLIVANRISEELSEISSKVYTRDLFGGDS
ncbi:nucleotide sugar dehydrogenase [Acinetobacter sp. YIM 103518]|uniref:UDP-glucose 6-dehydrogenase n=1 Tax=Acinetobacter faecalis TaxID=2665161 RepID=A0A6L6GHJ8_9GAMM|nr:nucleotide sugar dehydrogenase [Acinetobacter faecalis]MTD12272.1 nucleotide sugar dehydrogenase [Acinetobacter faecalis]